MECFIESKILKRMITDEQCLRDLGLDGYFEFLLEKSFSRHIFLELINEI